MGAKVHIHIIAGHQSTILYVDQAKFQNLTTCTRLPRYCHYAARAAELQRFIYSGWLYQRNTVLLGRADSYPLRTRSPRAGSRLPGRNPQTLWRQLLYSFHKWASIGVLGNLTCGQAGKTRTVRPQYHQMNTDQNIKTIAPHQSTENTLLDDIITCLNRS